MGHGDPGGGGDLHWAQDGGELPGLGPGGAAAGVWQQGHRRHRLGRGGRVRHRQTPGAQGQGRHLLISTLTRRVGAWNLFNSFKYIYTNGTGGRTVTLHR